VEIFRGYAQLPRPLRAPAIAIGNFDGVHRGHRAILALVKKEAQASQGESVLLTFEPHPSKILSPKSAPPLIALPERKLELVAQTGIDVTIVQPFDAALANMEPAEFAREVLKTRLGARVVVVGYNFTFGRLGRGTPEMLRSLGDSLGFVVRVVQPLELDGLVVSSTAVRQFVLEGRVDAALRLLGRPFEVHGRVVSGAGRGRRLGVPTANILPEEELLPRRGVYAAFVRLGSDRRMAVVNVGKNPTFVADGALSMEAHILDFDGELLGQRLALEFIHRLRDEQRFPDAASLVAQIRLDMATARQMLGSPGSNDET